MGLGWTEILLIGLVFLFLFGPSRLPSMGKSLGEAIRGFKKGLDSASDDEVKPSERVVHPHQDRIQNPSVATDVSGSKQEDKTHQS
jgi:sec-independent protein translocase protein TatA